MKFKIFIIVFLISTIALTEIPKAIFVSDTYKQGIYNISTPQEFNATAKLVINPPTTLLIIDSVGNQKFYKKFDNLNEIINLGTIRNGDLIAVIGNGEVAITK
ncbi:hypothetical protein CLPUN_32490 [Clostridium puniceum]|uniref:Uncharacterized protein n=1 Tax=Clostridium puniceum TaxID=29367 RepID=A0A1S8TCG9_9CLOT|nr:hypothetical protein [Clostridium puniceum]OOM75438.1 hypothetical protein CLPUN_32490 [Clostridium puniceum]